MEQGIDLQLTHSRFGKCEARVIQDVEGEWITIQITKGKLFDAGEILREGDTKTVRREACAFTEI